MIRHYGIPVKNLESAIDFYAQFYFVPYEYETAIISGKEVNLCKLVHKDGSMLELLEGKTASHHISISVNHLQFEALQSNHDTKMFNKDDVCYIKDNSGNIIEIVKTRGW